MFDDLHVLLQFAEAGSMVRAAARMHRTASAVTRQIQRLEAALGSPLLDRSVKPPRLTPIGKRVVEHSREVLRSLEQLKSLAAPDAEPQGLLRIGVSHALADSALSEPVCALKTEFPKLRLSLLTGLSSSLLGQLQRGELDLAIIVIAEPRASGIALPNKVVATDQMMIVASAALAVGSTATWQELAAHPWVLNPAGCLLRARVLDNLAQTGIPTTVAAEVHNLHLQLAFVESGYGLGLLPERFVHRYASHNAIRFIKPKNFSLRMHVAVVTSGALGSFEAAVRRLEANLATLDTPAPSSSTKRGIPAPPARKNLSRLQRPKPRPRFRS